MYLTPDSTKGSCVQKRVPIDDVLCSPKVQLSKATTASELLAAFSPKAQLKKEPLPWISPPQFPIAMTENIRARRHKERVSYQISDDSDLAPSPSVISSTVSTPQKRRLTHATCIIDLEESPEPEPLKTPPPRISSAGHSLRQHKDLQLSQRALENADKPRVKRRRVSRKQNKNAAIVLDLDAMPLQKTSRNEIRETIATETKGKRANFLHAKREYFLPLLPESNYISRLVEEHNQSDHSEEDLSVPYEAIHQQPQGYAYLDFILQLYCADVSAA